MASTTAGPSACQASGTLARMRRGAARPRTQSSVVEATSAAHTAIGTMAGGRSTSIGTSVSCVGTT